MFVENGNHENKENFYQDIITKFPKDTQKKILSEIIKKLKEDIKESNNIFFYSNEIVNEIEDKFNFFQGPLNYIQDLNNSSNGNPLSKGQFVSSGTNQISHRTCPLPHRSCRRRPRPQQPQHASLATSPRRSPQHLRHPPASR